MGVNNYTVTFSREFRIDAVDPIDALQQGRIALGMILEKQDPKNFHYEIKFKDKVVKEDRIKTFTSKTGRT